MIFEISLTILAAAALILAVNRKARIEALEHQMNEWKISYKATRSDYVTMLEAVREAGITVVRSADGYTVTTPTSYGAHMTVTTKREPWTS